MASILVIEDDSRWRKVLSEHLAKLGHQVVVAGEGRQGLETFARERVDAVVLDLHLPGMSGDEVLDHIKEQDAQVPVLILTGHNHLDSAVELMRRGAYCYMTKPVSHNQLADELERAIRFHRLARSKSRLEREIRPLREEVRRVVGEMAVSGRVRDLTMVGFWVDLDGGVERTPEALARLEKQFDLIDSVVSEFGGLSYQFVGDEILGLFGVEESEKHHRRGVEAAWRVRHLVGGVQAVAHSGPVTLDGLEADFSCTDDLVLNASLLLNLCRESKCGVLLSEPVYRRLEPFIVANPVGRLPMRHGPKEVLIYQVVELPQIV